MEAGQAEIILMTLKSGEQSYGYVNYLPTSLRDASGRLPPSKGTSDLPPWYKKFSICVDRLRSQGYGHKNACKVCRSKYIGMSPWKGKFPDCSNRYYTDEIDMLPNSPGLICIQWVCTAEMEKGMIDNL